MVQVKLKIEVTQKMLGPTKYRLTSEAIASEAIDPTKKGTNLKVWHINLKTQDTSTK